MDVQATTGNKSLRFLGYGILTLASLVGIWAIVIRLREGLIVTNMTQLVPWGFWIAFYIYFIGLSAGSFLLSTLVYVFGVKRFEAVGPLALFQALACLLMGMFLIFIDLGHPERFLNVFIHWNWTSVLAWESLFYVFYTIIILAELYYVLRPALARRARTGTSLNWLYRLLARGDQDPGPEWRERASRRMRILGLIGIPVAIGVHGGTGAIFAVVKSRPTWYTGLFPIIFLVSALASGGALLTFLAAATSKFHAAKKLELVRGLARLTVAVLAFDLLLEFSEILVVFYGGIPRHITGWHNILFGPFWWMFWFVQL
ncbi:MAG: molybdopterin oxidoreductase, partial [Caldilineae bacterium]